MYKLQLKNMQKLLLGIIFITATSFSQNLQKNILLELEQSVQSNKGVEFMISNPNSNPAESKRKNTGLAILYSLLLPGMGELYAENYSSGKYFTIAEGVLWGVYFGMNTYGNWQQDRYKSFAVDKAGISNSNKDDDYYATISEYLSIEDFNNEKLLERNFDQIYDESNYFWKWQTSEDRKSYRSMWVSSEQTFNDLRFVVGAMILNRVISAINAVRMVSAYNNQLEEEVSWDLSVNLKQSLSLPTTVYLNFKTSF